MTQVAATRAASITGPSAVIETIAGTEALCRIHHEWNALLHESDADCLFLTWEWLTTWWRHMGGDRRLSVVTVRLGSDLVAIAPFSISPARVREGRMLPFLEFLGSGFVGSDYLDIVARRGYEDCAVDALAKELILLAAGDTFMVRLTNVHRHECLAERLAISLNARRWHFDESQTNVCPYIPLESHSWESYLASLGGETRYNFNRKWKRLNRDFKVKFEAISDQNRLTEAIAVLIAHHNARWSERGGSDAFHNEDLVTFHHELSRIVLAQGWLRLYVLWLDGQPAASLYGFLYRDKFYFYQSGFDASYEKHSVGFLTMGLAIREAIAEGASEFDLLHGDEGYKSHWTTRKRALGRIELYPSGATSAAVRRWMQLGRIYRRVEHRVLTRIPL